MRVYIFLTGMLIYALSIFGLHILNERNNPTKSKDDMSIKVGCFANQSFSNTGKTATAD